MRKLLYGLLLVTLLAPIGVLAAGTATIKLDNGDSLKTSWQDALLRVDLPDDNWGHVVIRDNSGYLVTRLLGQESVIQAHDLLDLISQLDDNFDADKLKEFKVVSVKATSKTRTVAGIQGQVYRIQVANSMGQRQTANVLLTDNSQVVELTEHWLQAAKVLAGADLAKRLERALPADKKGILAVENGFKLQTISNEAPADKVFTLPNNSQDVNGMLEQLFEHLDE